MNEKLFELTTREDTSGFTIIAFGLLGFELSLKWQKRCLIIGGRIPKLL